jgi:ABC-type polysaccharide/polyol phosphate export permease
MFEIAKRELTDRYAGQIFDLFWAVIHPIFFLKNLDI